MLCAVGGVCWGKEEKAIWRRRLSRLLNVGVLSLVCWKIRDSSAMVLEGSSLSHRHWRIEIGYILKVVQLLFEPVRVNLRISASQKRQMPTYLESLVFLAVDDGNVKAWISSLQKAFDQSLSHTYKLAIWVYDVQKGLVFCRTSDRPRKDCVFDNTATVDLHFSK